ncbi:MAG: hypothetical protein EAX96_19695 [Candidatus Lokiarchaeota archaeon]|nr:hypothetical protein [Candidatus Lokiarchaeota archaeon]
MIDIIIGAVILFIMFYLAPTFHLLKNGSTLTKNDTGFKTFAALLGTFYTPFIRMVFWIIERPWAFKGPIQKIVVWFLGNIVTKIAYAGEIYTTDEIITMLRRIYDEEKNNTHFHVLLQPCVCRHASDNWSKTLPNMTCMHLNFFAHGFHQGGPEPKLMISMETAVELVKQYSKLGLIHIMYGMCPSNERQNWTKQIALCACHHHCVTVRCEIFFGNFGKEGIRGIHPFKKGDHYFEVDPGACLGIEKCGYCKKKCPFFVIEEDGEGKAFIDPNACYGCGVCSRFCNKNAINIKDKSKYHSYFIRKDIIAPENLISN